MSKYSSKKFLAMIMAMLMIMTCLVSPAVAPKAFATDAAEAEVFVGETTAATTKDREVTIMVSLEGNTTFLQTSDLQLASASHDQHMATLARAERQIEQKLSEKIDVDHYYSLLFNGFSFTGSKWMIDAINQMDGVTAFEAPVFELVQPEADAVVDLTPSMDKSTSLTGANVAWDMGYTGEGMVVAVLDTGIRRTHEAFSVMPKNGKIDLAYLRDVYAQYGDKIHGGTIQDINDIYYSEKLPFNWDYFDGDADPNHTASDHGTHVAGIAAGNNGKGFKGVAPDAQIVTMQVFQENGGASFDTIILALEDCVYLGVDALNMSLGSPAGHTAYSSVLDGLEEVYDALEAAGVSVAVAAGNEEHAYNWTNYGDWFKTAYRWPAENPDNSVIGSPSTFPGSFAVGSVVNTSKEASGYLISSGHEYYPGSVEAAPALCSLPAGEYDAVYVGEGTLEEIAAAGGAEGKIAIVTRGSVTFQNKANFATEAGAAGLIIFNNRAGTFNPWCNSTEIPYGSLSQADGQALLASFADGVHGKITVCDDFAYGSVSMALSSSWGSTADLKVKPEIAAPGDGITSSIGFGEDDSYQTWSGTSMATPSVAGGLLLIKQRLREEFPNADAAQINELAIAVMMSTAHKVQGFVRQQGAGLMDVEAALNTDAYISVPGANRPKLELDDSENGVFTFSIEVNNFGDTNKTYAVQPLVLTESVSDYEHMGSIMVDRNFALEVGQYLYVANPEAVTVKTITNTIKDVTSLCELTAPETITVAAGESVTVNMTLTCTDELMAYFKENCPAGMFLEGYIKLLEQGEDGTDLSVPFLGFVGDWDYPAMVDDGFWWQNPYGQNNMSQMSTSNGTYVGFGTLEQGLGLNYYADMVGQPYVADRNAISPNGDGLMDAVDYMEFSFLRNPRTVKLYVEDAEGNVLETFLDTTYGYRKEYWNTSSQTLGYSSIVFDFTAQDLEENETVYLVLESWLDHDEYDPADNKTGYLRFPVTKDTIAPAIHVIEGGIEILDANYTAYYAVYADAERTELLYETGVFAEERGVAETYTTDLTTFYVATADYARNEAFYLVNDGEVYALDENAFGHDGRRIVAFQQINYEAGYWEFGWKSFLPYAFNAPTLVSELSYDFTEASEYSYGYDVISSAVYKDGTLYAAAMRCLYEVDPVTYEKTEVGYFWYENAKNYDGSKTVSLRNILSHPETGELYGFGRFNVPGEGTHYWFSHVNPETLEVTPLWKFADIWPYALEFMDANTLIKYDLSNQALDLVNFEDGTILKSYKNINLKDPLRNGTQQAMSGVAADLLYDAKENCVYYSGDGSWFRHDRKGHIGVVKYDFDTGKVTLHTTGLGAGLAIFGLHFADSVKPRDYYAVMMMIDAIGNVTLESEDAIKSARAAYEALSETQKALVSNLDTLLKAESRYLTLVVEDAALTSAKVYALLVLENLEKNVTDQCVLNAVEAAREAIDYATTVEEVYAILDEIRYIVENGCVAGQFTDVSANAWYHESIEFVVASGLMNGVSETKFAPEENMTRAQLVTVLYRLAGEPSVEGMTNGFEDVAAGTWYTDAVIWAANNGIVKGIDETTFAPNADVTREQLVTILYRFFGEPEADVANLEGYADAAAISEYAVPAMAWAVGSGIVNGVTETVLAPQGTAIRAQIATIVMRVIMG